MRLEWLDSLGKPSAAHCARVSIFALQELVGTGR